MVKVWDEFIGLIYWLQNRIYGSETKYEDLSYCHSDFCIWILSGTTPLE